MNIPTGTIIVVAPEGASGRRLLNVARMAGCRVVAATVFLPEQEEYLPEYMLCTPANPGACDRLVWRPDYELLVADLASERNVKAVIPGSEFGVEVAERLAEHFGVRGNPATTSAQRRNKFEMKTVIAAAGLDHAKGALVQTVEEGVAYVHGNLDYPIVVKPPDGVSARNVIKCQDESELRTALAYVVETPDGYDKVPHAAVVEEFIPGDEYAVNLFGDADKLVITSVWRYEWKATPYCRHCYWNVLLQDPDDPSLAALCAYAKRLYRAVGIRIGPAHAEIKLSPQGPVAMEIGARMMGNDYETFAHDGMCLDVPAETVRVFMTGRSGMPDHPRMRERLAYAKLPYVTEGVVTAVHGMDAIRALPTYLRENLPVKPGDRIAVSRWTDECFCGVWLKAATEAELVRDLAFVHREFRVETA